LPWVKSIIDVTYATEKNRVADLLKSLETKEPASSCSI
ncbi:transcriptional regulator, partial [Providencia huashanensis]